MLNTIEEWNLKYGPFDSNTRLVTLDVVGLYTNIPHDDLKTALRFYLRQRLNNNVIPPTEEIIRVVDHALLNNVFSFECDMYRQIHGTAMGTPMASSVANLFMGWLEEDFLHSSGISFNADLYKRFIDDCFLLWNGTDDDLNRFTE